MTEFLSKTFALADEIERFTPGAGRSGRRAETLIKTEHLRVVLVTMLAGSTMQEHTAPGPITIQPLRGRFRISVGAEERDLATDELIAIPGRQLHAIHALEAGAFLLTIGWPPDVTGAAAVEDV